MPGSGGPTSGGGGGGGGVGGGGGGGATNLLRRAMAGAGPARHIPGSSSGNHENDPAMVGSFYPGIPRILPHERVCPVWSLAMSWETVSDLWAQVFPIQIGSELFRLRYVPLDYVNYL